MEQEVEQKLKEAETVQDMLQTLISYYRLDLIRPGTMVRSALIQGLKSAIRMIKPIKR